MRQYFCGFIEFKHELSDKEVDQMEKDINESLYCEFQPCYVELTDSPDVSDEIADWLKKRGNDVKEGCTVEFYGDYDGAIRYQNGEWHWSDAQSLFFASYQELIDELKYRGSLSTSDVIKHKQNEGNKL